MDLIYKNECAFVCLYVCLNFIDDWFDFLKNFILSSSMSGRSYKLLFTSPTYMKLPTIVSKWRNGYIGKTITGSTSQILYN